MARTIKTPLGNVRGLGSARSGSEHFFLQRVTGLALVALAAVFVFVVVKAAGLPYAQVRAMFASPLVAILMILFVGAGVYHMRLGMQVIIEDYAHHEGAKMAALIANTFFSVLVAVACVYAILRIGFGA